MLDTTILTTYQFTFSGALTRAKRARCKAPKISKFRYQSGPQPDLDIWWRHPHLQNGVHAEKHEGRSVPGSLLCLEVSFPHTTLRAVTLDNEKSGVWRKNAVRWTFVRSWEVKRPNTRVFQLKEMSDKEQNIEKKKVSVIFWTVGKIFFEICIKFACW